MKRWVDRFAQHAGEHGGLKPTTVKVYLVWLEHLARFLERRGVRTVRRLRLAELDAFMAQRGARMSPRSLYNVRAALRAFLRYLYVVGELEWDFGGELARPSRFSADQRPKYLPWAEVEALLSGVDRDSPVGKRAYAVLALLACQGLRAGEVAKLRLEDLDFEAGSIFVRERKNGRSGRLPMSARAREALEDYLRVRPANVRAEVFLTVKGAPTPMSPGAVGQAASWRLRRRFPKRLEPRGAHVLRHSFAKCLLDRGARLTDLGLMLGHRHLRSTLMYARIATEELREVADNYARLL